MSSGNDFIGCDTTCTRNKSKNRKCDCIKLKMCAAMEKVNQKTTAEWEKTFANIYLPKASYSKYVSNFTQQQEKQFD
jgi:hypothetical protein